MVSKPFFRQSKSPSLLFSALFFSSLTIDLSYLISRSFPLILDKQTLESHSFLVMQRVVVAPPITNKGVSDSVNSTIGLSDLWLLLRIFCFLSFAYTAGLWGFSVLWVLLISALIIIGVIKASQSIKWHETLLFQKKLQQPETLLQSLPLVPAWLSFPDLERADFIQEIVAQLWPQIKIAAEGIVLEQITPLFNTLRPQPLTGLGFSRLDLGNVPPQIPGVKLHRSDGTEIMLDIECEFNGNPIIDVEARAGPVAVTVSVADFYFRGTARILLKPLNNIIPCIGAIAASLVTKPTINFRLSTVGVSVMSIPGLNDLLYDLIKTQIANQLVWPKKIVVPIQKLSDEVLAAIASAEAVGTLLVRIHGARDMKNSNSYVQVTLGALRKDTSIATGRGEPEWGDDLEFPVHDPRTETVRFVVKSKENLINPLNAVNMVADHVRKNKSQKLGDCQLPIERLLSNVVGRYHNDQATEPMSMWLPLLHTSRGKGQLHIKVQYKPFREKGAIFDEDGQASLPSGTGLHQRLGTQTNMRSVNGMLLVKVHHGAGLKGSNCYALLRVGKETFRTSSLPGDSPAWNSQFEIVNKYNKDYSTLKDTTQIEEDLC